ncbi:MAG: hypothetical protein JJT88_13395 [Gammaproteobacteria bacterium]|nr:hypothetical protein [Gammaproteobacteria bacterium]
MIDFILLKRLRERTVPRVLGFVLLWALIYGHYHWSASLLQPTFGAIEFDASEPVTARVGPMPIDRYGVTFRFAHGYRSKRPDAPVIHNQLRQGRVGLDIRVTGWFGREVLSYQLAQISDEWRFTSRTGDPTVLLWGPARFMALPLERYTVTARLSGDNAFLESREIILGLTASRNNGYHGLVHIALYYLSGALFALIALVWIIYKLVLLSRRHPL